VLASVAQLTSVADKEANRGAARAAVRRAAEAGSRLVVLPEAAQWPFGEPTSDLTAPAEPLDGPYVEALAQVASETGVTAVAGMFEPSGDPQRVFNTVVAVGPGGLLGAYRKLHLFDALGWRESGRVAPGDPAADRLVFPVDGLRCGVMTCYDLRFPEMARSLVDAGATALVLPAYWVAGPGKAEIWELLVRARAVENTAYVLAAAQPGPGACGRSMVVDPAGDVWASAAVDGEELLTAELSPEHLRSVRASMPVLAHRRFTVQPR
jgi:predicted amidohydrolase